MNSNSFFYKYCEENPNVDFIELDVCPSYWIGNNGVIYSKHVDRIMLTQTSCNHGYERVLIKFDGKLRNMRVHRLVAMAFLDDATDPKAIEVDHINHHRCDNRIENLRWVTRKENMRNLKSNYKKHQKISISHAHDHLKGIKCGKTPVSHLR